MKSIETCLEGTQTFGPGLLIHFQWQPAEACAPGQFFLVRCTSSSNVWDPYLRRALLPALITPDRLALWVDDVTDRGLVWLRAQPEGTPVDMLGPGGHGFDLPISPSNVLILAQDAGIGPVWPVLLQTLASGCQVTVALGTSRGEDVLKPTAVPIAAEYRLATADGSAGRPGDVLDLLAGLERWPDRIYAAIPAPDWPRLRAWIEGWRVHLETGFAQVLVHADIVCGVGVCLACVIERGSPRRGQSSHLTRACVHGPVLDLAAIT